MFNSNSSLKHAKLNKRYRLAVVHFFKHRTYTPKEATRMVPNSRRFRKNNSGITTIYILFMFDLDYFCI